MLSWVESEKSFITSGPGSGPADTQSTDTPLSTRSRKRFYKGTAYSLAAP